MFELTTLKRAFDGKSLPALVVKILRGRIPTIPTKYSSNLRNLIHSMLSQSTAERPAVDAILKLPWLRKHLERYADMMMEESCKQMANLSEAQAADSRKQEDADTQDPGMLSPANGNLQIAKVLRVLHCSNQCVLLPSRLQSSM